MKLISIVLPCLNEEQNLPLLIPEIIKAIPKKYKFEIICVNDGSVDKTRLVLHKIAKKNKNIKIITFHRRFGHQAALRAGILYSRGNAVVTMDSDFQHPPKLLPKFIKKWEDGFDLVQGKKHADNTTGFLRKKQRSLGYFIWKAASGGILVPGVSDFRLMDHEIAQYVRSSPEHEFFLRGVVMLAAANPTFIKYRVGKRLHGKSSYSLKMFVNMFVNGVISFSTKPLRVASMIGLGLFVFASFFLGIDIVRALVEHQPIIQGWTTAVLLMLLLNGILFLYLGILGEYISIIFKEVKRRPHFVIEETVNIKV